MESISSPKVSQGKQNNPRIEGLPAPLSGCRNGRPPDTNALVVVPSSLERSANPIYDEDQQVMKRSRGDGQETMDVEVDVQEDGSDVVMQITAKDGLSCEEEGTVRNDDIPRVEGTPPGMNKPSFRDMLTGRGSTAGSSPALPELDVEILAEDVCVSSVDDVCKPHAEKVNSDNQPTSGKSKSREVEERFGPWMQVPTRKSGRVMQGRGSSTVINSRKDFVEHQSGKFAVLAQEEDEHELIEVNTLGDSSLLELNHVGDVVVTTPRSMVKEPITGYASKEIMNAENCKEMSSDGRILLHGSGSESAVRGLNVKEGDRNVAVAPNELVVHSKTKLNTGNHTVVKILERQSGTISKSSSTSRSNVGGESAATKGGQGLLIGKNGIRKKQPVRKKQDARAPSKVTLGEWIGDLSRDIAVSGSRGNRHRDNVPVANDGPDTAVQWRANTTFEQGLGQ
ncbi:hypothetical protein V6N12_022524 [Hibiscus sabdariffa]|uniref:Uncharacterized protein n=1 Tax=Hibiscus sabdariffa TaxID=183260 RepID=A0ABR2FV55_9ROSI